LVSGSTDSFLLSCSWRSGGISSFIGECDVNHPFVSLFGQARQKAFGFEPVDDAAGGAGIKIQKLADFALGRLKIGRGLQVAKA